MDEIKAEILKVYGNKIRIRACGMCFQDNKILLVKHLSLGERGIFWAPPGGGIDFGETAEEALVREFKEEIGVDIIIEEFLFVHEFLSPPLHALELFFKVSIKNGLPVIGIDPEMAENKQILQEAAYFTAQQIKEHDPEIFHNILLKCEDFEGLTKLRGYHKYENSMSNNRK